MVRIEAFCAEFANEPSVTLTIKTTYNETNELYSVLESLSNRDRRKIRFMDSVISSTEMTTLLAQCDALFVPSHGEGFLLPAAEAMRAGKLVITTECGGNEAFCTDATCVLIPTKRRSAQTHLGRPGSWWFQANISDIRKGLRDAVLNKRGRNTARIDAAREKINTFTWERAAQRFIQSISDSSNDAPSSYVIVSRFRQNCGISVYCEELCDELRKNGHNFTVLAEKCDDLTLNGEEVYNVLRCWNNTDSDIVNLANIINRDFPNDHVLIEHHAGIFSWAALEKLLSLIDRRQRKAVVELHAAEGFNFATPCDAIFVSHNDDDYKALYQTDCLQNVMLLPLAARTAEAPTCYYTESEPLRLIGFGKCGEHKRFECILEIVSRLKATGVSVEAKILCAVNRSDPKSVRAAHRLWQTRIWLGLEREVVLDFAFLPADVIRAAMAASHVALFPYDNVAEGASSAVRFAMSCQTLSICSHSQIFFDVANFVVRNDFRDVSSVAKQIVELVSDRATHEAAIQRQNKFLAFSSFEQHVKRLRNACNR